MWRMRFASSTRGGSTSAASRSGCCRRRLSRRRSGSCGGCWRPGGSRSAQVAVEPVEHARVALGRGERVAVPAGAVGFLEAGQLPVAVQTVEELLRLAGPELLAFGIGDQERSVDLADLVAELVGVHGLVESGPTIAGQRGRGVTAAL